VLATRRGGHGKFGTCSVGAQGLAPLSLTGLRTEGLRTGLLACKAGVNRSQREGVLNDNSIGFAVTPLCTVPLLGPLARAHAHSSVVMWDALSSLPPQRRVSDLARCGLASVHRLPCPRGYSSGIAFDHVACCIALGL
jgi:hypothetical protein